MISVTIASNLGSDPELRFLPSGQQVCNFSLPVNNVRGKGENRREETTWYRVAVFGNRAEFVNNNFKKGDAIIVTSDEVKLSLFNKKDGTPSGQIEIVASNVYFAPRNSGTRGGNDAASNDDWNAPTESESEIPF